MLETNLYDEGACYTNPFNGMIKINIVQNISDLLISVDRMRLAEKIHTSFPTGHDRNLKIESDIVGSVKLIAVIENLYKIALLQNDFVIHQIDKEKCGILAKKQKKEPILLQDVLNFENILPAVPPLCISSLTKNTIQISLILDNAKYRSVLNFDADEIKTIKEINDGRNSLHYITSTENVRSNEINVAYLKLQKKIVQELIIINDKVGCAIPSAAYLNRKKLEKVFKPS